MGKPMPDVAGVSDISLSLQLTSLQGKSFALKQQIMAEPRLAAGMGLEHPAVPTIGVARSWL